MANYYEDGFCAAYTEEEYSRFVEFLKERRETHILYEVGNLNEVRLLTTDDMEVEMEVGDGIRGDTEKNSGLFWQLSDGTIIPSRETAISQALNQTGCRGQFLDRLSNGEKADLLNGYVFPHAGGSKRLFVEDEKVSGFVSGTDFAEIPAVEVMELADSFMRTEFPKAKFEGGTFTHELVTARWNLSEHRTEFEALEGTHFIPSFSVVTSDCGLSSVTVRPYMKGGNWGFPVNPLRVAHRGKGDKTEEVREAFSQAYAMVKATVTDIEALKSVEIEHPVTTITRVARAHKLPKREALEVIDTFQLVYGTGTCTAYDCFRHLCEVLQMLPKSFTQLQRIKVEDEICRCIKVNWRSFDLPGNFCW